MIEALDGPSLQGKITINDTTPIELKVGASSFPDRKVVTLQSNGRFYVYFANEGEVPNATKVSSDGFLQYARAKETYEASETQIIYVMAVSGNVELKIAERA